MYVVESCTHREVLRVHINAGASKKYPISESVLIAHMKVMYEDKEIGKMRFCEPYSCMEPILDLLETKKLFIVYEGSCLKIDANLFQKTKE